MFVSYYLYEPKNGSRIREPSYWGDKMKRFTYTLTFLLALTLIVSGCSKLAEPNWSKLEVISDVEQFTDGSMYTTAQTQIPEYVKGESKDDSRFTDAIVSLKKPQDIRRILIKRRAEDAVPVDLNVYILSGKEGEDWKLAKEVRGEEKTDIDVKISSTPAAKIKIKAQRASRTASGKSAIAAKPNAGAGNKQTGRKATGGSLQADRVLREPVKFAEIEIYGISSTPVATKTEEKKK